MPKNLKDELFNILSSLKKKMKLIKEDRKKLGEIFEAKSIINKSIEDKNKEIERIERSLKNAFKLDDKKKQNIEDDIKSLEVAVKSLKEKVEREIKMEKIAEDLSKYYINSSNQDHVLRLYEFITKMYNLCLKKEVREFLKKYAKEFKENSTKEYSVTNINELYTLLNYFSSPNKSTFPDIKEVVNKKLFFDIFREVDKILPEITLSKSLPPKPLNIPINTLQNSMPVKRTNLSESENILLSGTDSLVLSSSSSILDPKEEEKIRIAKQKEAELQELLKLKKEAEAKKLNLKGQFEELGLKRERVIQDIEKLENDIEERKKAEERVNRQKDQQEDQLTKIEEEISESEKEQLTEQQELKSRSATGPKPDLSLERRIELYREVEKNIELHKNNLLSKLLSGDFKIFNNVNIPNQDPILKRMIETEYKRIAEKQQNLETGANRELLEQVKSGGEEKKEGELEEEQIKATGAITTSPADTPAEGPTKKPENGEQIKHFLNGINGLHDLISEIIKNQNKYNLNKEENKQLYFKYKVKFYKQSSREVTENFKKVELYSFSEKLSECLRFNNNILNYDDNLIKERVNRMFEILENIVKKFEKNIPGEFNEKLERLRKIVSEFTKKQEKDKETNVIQEIQDKLSMEGTNEQKAKQGFLPNKKSLSFMEQQFVQVGKQQNQNVQAQTGLKADGVTSTSKQQELKSRSATGLKKKSQQSFQKVFENESLKNKVVEKSHIKTPNEIILDEALEEFKNENNLNNFLEFDSSLDEILGYINNCILNIKYEGVLNLNIISEFGEKVNKFKEDNKKDGEKKSFKYLNNLLSSFDNISNNGVNIDKKTAINYFNDLREKILSFKEKIAEIYLKIKEELESDKVVKNPPDEDVVAEQVKAGAVVDSKAGPEVQKQGKASGISETLEKLNKKLELKLKAEQARLEFLEYSDEFKLFLMKIEEAENKNLFQNIIDNLDNNTLDNKEKVNLIITINRISNEIIGKNKFDIRNIRVEEINNEELIKELEKYLNLVKDNKGIFSKMKNNNLLTPINSLLDKYLENLEKKLNENIRVAFEEMFLNAVEPGYGTRPEDNGPRQTGEVVDENLEATPSGKPESNHGLESNINREFDELNKIFNDILKLNGEINENKVNFIKEIINHIDSIFNNYNYSHNVIKLKRHYFDKHANNLKEVFNHELFDTKNVIDSIEKFQKGMEDFKKALSILKLTKQQDNIYTLLERRIELYNKYNQEQEVRPEDDLTVQDVLEDVEAPDAPAERPAEGQAAIQQDQKVKLFDLSIEAIEERFSDLDKENVSELKSLILDIKNEKKIDFSRYNKVINWLEKEGIIDIEISLLNNKKINFKTPETRLTKEPEKVEGSAQSGLNATAQESAQVISGGDGIIQTGAATPSEKPGSGVSSLAGGLEDNGPTEEADDKNTAAQVKGLQPAIQQDQVDPKTNPSNKPKKIIRISGLAKNQPPLAVIYAPSDPKDEAIVRFNNQYSNKYLIKDRELKDREKEEVEKVLKDKLNKENFIDNGNIYIDGSSLKDNNTYKINRESINNKDNNILSKNDENNNEFNEGDFKSKKDIEEDIKELLPNNNELILESNDNSGFCIKKEKNTNTLYKKVTIKPGELYEFEYDDDSLLEKVQIKRVGENIEVIFPYVELSINTERNKDNSIQQPQQPTESVKQPFPPINDVKQIQKTEQEQQPLKTVVHQQKSPEEVLGDLQVASKQLNGVQKFRQRININRSDLYEQNPSENYPSREEIIVEEQERGYTPRKEIIGEEMKKHEMWKDFNIRQFNMQIQSEKKKCIEIESEIENLEKEIKSTTNNKKTKTKSEEELEKLEKKLEKKKNIIKNLQKNLEKKKKEENSKTLQR